MKSSSAAQLSAIRSGIDEIDDHIVAGLARRRKLVVRLARIKKKKNIPVYDPQREYILLARLKKKALRHGLESRFVEKIFSLIMAHSKKVQSDEVF